MNMMALGYARREQVNGKRGRVTDGPCACNGVKGLIIVKGPMKLAEGGAARLKSAMEAMTAATRAAVGCKQYSLAVDANDPDLLHVNEEWVDQTSLGAHLVSDHLIDFQLAMRRTRVLSADVNIHYPDGKVKRLINM
jgi:quinol monooxygenase YgiN